MQLRSNTKIGETKRSKIKRKQKRQWSDRVTKKQNMDQQTTKVTTPPQPTPHSTSPAKVQSQTTATAPSSVMQDFDKLFKDPALTPSYSRYLKKFFRKNNTLSLHKPVRKNFSRRRTVVYAPQEVFQSDLVDYIKYSGNNSGYRYIMVIIDAFSRRAYVRKLKNKGSEETARALEDFLNNINYLPRSLYTDAGLEYTNNRVQRVLKNFGLQHYIMSGKHKASMAERFIRTLKTNLEMYFYENHTHRWVDVLNQFVNNKTTDPPKKRG